MRERAEEDILLHHLSFPGNAYFLYAFFLKCQYFSSLPDVLKLRLPMPHFLPVNNFYSTRGEQFPQLSVHEPGNLQQWIAFVYTGYYRQKGKVCSACWRVKFSNIYIIYAFSLPKIEKKELVKFRTLKDNSEKNSCVNVLEIYELVRNSVDHQKALFPSGDSALLGETEKETKSNFKKCFHISLKRV